MSKQQFSSIKSTLKHVEIKREKSPFLCLHASKKVNFFFNYEVHFSQIMNLTEAKILTVVKIEKFTSKRQKLTLFSCLALFMKKYLRVALTSYQFLKVSIWPSFSRKKIKTRGSREQQNCEKDLNIGQN